MDSIINIVKEFPEKFWLPSYNLQDTPCIQHRIPLTDGIPLNTRL